MDVRQKGLVAATLSGIVVAFEYFSVPLAALAAIASLPFLLAVLLQ